MGSVYGEDGRVLVEQVERPIRFHARARGLLGRGGLDANQGLWLDPCDSIHMFGMQFPIDVVFLRGNVAQRLCAGVEPFQVRWSFRASAALELRTGSIERLGLTQGAHIEFRKWT